jgi:hypothetical protein
MALLDRCDGHYIFTPQIICYIAVLKVLRPSEDIKAWYIEGRGPRDVGKNTL